MPPRENQQNGDLLGYKIYYKNEEKPDQEEEVEVVPAATTAHMLLFMDTYTTYTIHILAFNAAGDGPRSLPVTVKTQQASCMPNQFSCFQCSVHMGHCTEWMVNQNCEFKCKRNVLWLLASQSNK